MPESVINLLIQIPIVGAFIWFILKWSERLDACTNKRDQLWMEFLREERAHRAEAIGRMAEEMKIISNQLAELYGMLAAHDAAAAIFMKTPRAGQRKNRNP